MATETLRPNAAGDNTDIPSIVGATNHYEAVDEASADDASTYVYNDSDTEGALDLYNLPSSGVGSGTINKITVYARTYMSAFFTNASISIKSGTTTSYSAEKRPDSSSTWQTKSQEWSTNPDTSSAWTWSDIADLQIGIELIGGFKGAEIRCTQLYVEIDYTEAATGTNTQINIGDDWKEIEAAQINIGDTWKEVAGMQINIGDAWKEIF